MASFSVIQTCEVNGMTNLTGKAQLYTSLAEAKGAAAKFNSAMPDLYHVVMKNVPPFVLSFDYRIDEQMENIRGGV